MAKKKVLLIGIGSKLIDPNLSTSTVWYANRVRAAAHRLEMDSALLVRPDGFVAWRTEAAAEDPEGTLDQVLSRLLCSIIVGES